MNSKNRKAGLARDQKNLVKRAGRLRNRELRDRGEAAPFHVWLSRLDGGTSEDRSAGFTCRNCGAFASWEDAGSAHRNHCPRCLCSVHLDEVPGDRAADCGGLMEPIAVWVRAKGEWAIIHRCRQCGALSSNRIGADDDPTLLMSLAVRPLAQPPFPLERLGSERAPL